MSDHNPRCYRTYVRSCKSFKDLSRARKITQSRNLTIDEAQRQCDQYNDNRNSAQIARGTKMEFEIQ